MRTTTMPTPRSDELRPASLFAIHPSITPVAERFHASSVSRLLPLGVTVDDSGCLSGLAIDSPKVARDRPGRRLGRRGGRIAEGT